MTVNNSESISGMVFYSIQINILFYSIKLLFYNIFIKLLIVNQLFLSLINIFNFIK